MLFTLAAFFLGSFTLEAFALPNDHITPHTSNSSSTSPIIETTILSANGTNLSASFRTMLYQQPRNVTSNTSLNVTRAPSAYQIDTCDLPYSAKFLRSQCSHRWGFRKPNLQRYTIECDVGPVFKVARGQCAPDEICVNQPWHTETGDVIANCISKSAFEEVDGSRLPPLIEKTENFMASKSLAGHKMAMLVSEQDGSTPLGASVVEMDAIADGGGLILQNLCRNCFGMRTQKLPLGLQAFRSRLVLMDAKAIIGILWLSVL